MSYDYSDMRPYIILDFEYRDIVLSGVFSWF